VFSVINILLEHAGIRITLIKGKNELSFRCPFFEIWREPRRDYCKQPVGEYLSLGTHLSHVNWRAQNNGVGLLNRAIKFLHIVIDNTTPIAIVATPTTPARFDI